MNGTYSEKHGFTHRTYSHAGNKRFLRPHAGKFFGYSPKTMVWLGAHYPLLEYGDEVILDRIHHESFTAYKRRNPKQ